MNPCPLFVAATLSFGLLAGPARADPMVASVAALPLDHLKASYLACDRAASETVLDAHAFRRCASVGDELLKRGFDGDFDRLIVWWRVEKTKAARAEASAAPPR